LDFLLSRHQFGASEGAAWFAVTPGATPANVVHIAP